MGYIAEFKGWSELTLSDLLVAYRKAKADNYFENSFPTAIKFAEYEQRLRENLESLLSRLRDKSGFSHDRILLGNCRLLPKKLGIEPKPGNNTGHAHFSDPDRAFSLFKNERKLYPEFRVVGDFPVDAHVISALWINMVGHKFDARLGDACYGARLRRIRDRELLDKNAPKPFHITAPTSFSPYFEPYKRWRNDGLEAIRNELEQNRKVIAVSLDLRSYYHLVDPSFVGKTEFQESIGFFGDNALSEAERLFTKEIADFLQNWSDKASEFAKLLQGKTKVKVGGGLVIGLTATRIISNVLLQKWDRLIQERVTPIHYGRYVDDMFLVMHDPGNIESSKALMEFLKERLGKEVLDERSEESGFWEIHLGKSYQSNSRLQLQADKQKLFILEGQGGLDLLDSIEKEIVELSSERRLMPSPDQLEYSTAARVLSAAGVVGEHADTLRRADGLTIRRLSWSLQLRHVETLANDLPPVAWKTQREDFYAFAHNHILRPEKLFEHYAYLPRLLGFAIGLNEWEQAEAIVRRSLYALKQLEEAVSVGSDITINGYKCSISAKVWKDIKGSLAWAYINAAAANYPIELLFESKRKRAARRLARVFMDQLWQALTSLEDWLDFDVNSGNFDQKAPLLASTDLARKPYKRILASANVNGLLKLFDKKEELRILQAFRKAELVDTDTLSEFLGKTRRARLAGAKPRRTGDAYRPYLFPTRPYTPSEIAALDPRCVGLGEAADDSPHELWARYVSSIRGVWVRPALSTSDRNQQPTVPKKRKIAVRTLRIGTREKNTIVVAITNIATADECWEATASGKPKLTLDRYKRIAELVNQAIKLKPSPDYLMFPELSLPLEWVDSVARKLMGSGISLIAGTEYRHLPNNEIYSEACMQLLDDRLGFPSSVRIWQPKLEPAVGEDKELTSKYGLAWKDFGAERKPVYDHNGFHFGVMVCSELQNSKARVRFQGLVDALMVISWNQDLDTFSALVESAALDVHAYTILVNNRRYGDSRVRSPAKESFRRDIARIRGGKNDFCVAVELDIAKLRAFQSRSKRWPDENDPFKPVPEGFNIAAERKRKPPK